MGRLTNSNYRNDKRYLNCGDCAKNDCTECSKILAALDRLAAYEDTRMEPEEIGKLAVKMEAARPYKAFFEDLVDGQKLSEALSHIRYLAQADREGRCVELWSNPGDVVLDPFDGIGSTGYQALKMGRRHVGVELKRSYYALAVENCRAAECERAENAEGSLFDLLGRDENANGG